MSSFVAVASRDHVQTARKGGLVQAGHEKKSPLQRLQTGDGIVCYSARMVFEEDEKCQRFTALGTVTDDTVYPVQVREDVAPYRVDVAFEDCEEIEVRLLLRRLCFIENEDAWGLHFRRGRFEIPERDSRVLRVRMQPSAT